MPSITTWTRLEPRTRDEDPLRGLEARVADPLWLLARQWQLGEFEGEDGGAPVQATLQVRRMRLNRYLPRAVNPGEQAAGQPYDADRPLEALVERPDGEPDLRQRARAGRELLRHLRANGLEAQASRYVAAAPFDKSADPEVASFLALVRDRVPDGLKVRATVEADLAHTTDAKLRGVLGEWVKWLDGIYGTPAAPGAFCPERLEHQFSVAGQGSPVLVAPEHRGGALDWYSFDVVPNASLGTAGAETSLTVTATPIPAHYPGMPAERFWQFEDGRVWFGGVEAGPEDLGRMLLVEFALAGSEDWFLVPVAAPVGTLQLVSRLDVVDTFGKVTTLAPADEGRAGNARWSMFRLSQGAGQAGLPAIIIPPTAGVGRAGISREELRLIRDEAANCAWAIERTVESPLGETVDLHRRDQAAAAAPPAPRVEARYTLETSVPSHWTPLLATQVAPGSFALRRGTLATGATPPEGRLLQELALLREEALPRMGLTLARQGRYARWIDGRAVAWSARVVTPGGGEPPSGLRFDSLD